MGVQARNERKVSMRTIEHNASTYTKMAEKGIVRVKWDGSRFSGTWKKSERVGHDVVGFYDDRATKDMIVEDMIDALKRDFVTVIL